MNRRFVTIVFLPGAAGNFICRCLNLLNGFHVFEPVDGSGMPATVQEKLNLLKYDDVQDWIHCHKNSDITWIDFEHRFHHYIHFKSHCDFPTGEVGVTLEHPFNSNVKRFDKFIGQDDEKFLFYIDPIGAWDWMLVHADLKDSHQTFHMFKVGKSLTKDSNVNKISLKNIVCGPESFIEEFHKICKTIKHQLCKEEHDAVLSLYKQWKLTTLDNDTVSLKKNEMIDLAYRLHEEIMSNLNDTR